MDADVCWIISLFLNMILMKAIRWWNKEKHKISIVSTKGVSFGTRIFYISNRKKWNVIVRFMQIANLYF